MKLRDRPSAPLSTIARVSMLTMLVIAGVVPGGFVPTKANAAELLLISGEGDSVKVTAAALRTRDLRNWTNGGRWTYALAPEWQIGLWNARHSGSAKSQNAESQIVDGSVTGVLTIRPRDDDSPYYLDLGFGFHLLSHTRLGERNFGSSFQFGELLGLGADFGESRRYSVVARVQHVSNGGIKPPNHGVTFMQLLMMYRF